MKEVIVSRLHGKIIEGFGNGLNIQKVASSVKTTEYQVKYIVKELLRVGYLIKSGRNLVPAEFNFVIGSRSDFLKDRVTIKEHIETVQAIKRYKPTTEDVQKVMELVNKNVPRTKIAQMLNMKKSEVLWTIAEFTRPNQGENRPDTYLTVTETEYKIFNNLNLFDDINKIAKNIKITNQQLHDYLDKLEQIGAIMINRNNKKYTYLQNDVYLKIKKENTNENQVQEAK